mmetsp:Transcript_24977/g.34743  ORF Transcript_24977/g.34743 Transcript_24977/m.34743 type:complete len:233 (+) Transcript_24977:126-824(+)|eukprot:CAMPEP_0184488014 /NCGR_PEP_ID=MMETSP0113_2-20130426/10478_1 /TAXON_ID=91329 /ORGANISM="Norrisiella sphaerica, Strain BC52" /LENGTH=232 /DNA_ID=CAMNT_0026870477 /DNA_START=129 /DNA_END=827 /DNA_ORIENTATION=+
MPALLLPATAIATLVGINVLQAVYPLLKPSPIPTEADLSKITVSSLENLGRSGLIGLYHSLPSGAPLSEGNYEGQLLKVGPLHPVSRLITHRMFPPSNCDLWLGKRIVNEVEGDNIFRSTSYKETQADKEDVPKIQNLAPISFTSSTCARPFRLEAGQSVIDKRPCLRLDYSTGKNKFPWSGMCDELREIRPGMYLGLGSMAVTGGTWNSALFVLEKRKETPPPPALDVEKW